ncbi:mechanosensitive ion channel family protein [Desertivirga brevis]|uniref:mechanosensitive ion channel family protein n=1 Tax=Desertivirga brevis TaxID=2810310 RepID=UPI001A974AD5|nr:mechanosensitive ion channel family protein [Pedobacter sp. SYSU D00873]
MSFYTLNFTLLKNFLDRGVFLYVLFCFLWLVPLTQAAAQVELLPKDSSASSAGKEPVYLPDSLGRRTPRGAVEGFISAVASENYARAGMYLRLDPALKKKQSKEELARSLQQLLDSKGHIIPYSMLSDKPTGALNDNLGPNLEKIGTASTNNEEFDLLLESTLDGDGAPVWLFSSETIQRIPLLVAEAPIAPLIDRVSPAVFERTKWGGIPVAHWLGAFVLLVIVYILAWGITHFILFLIPFFYKNAKVDPTASILKAFALPIRLYITIWLFSFAMQEAGISIILRQSASNLMIIVAIVAVMLLLWQLLVVTTEFFEKRLINHRNQAGVSAILFLRRTAKVGLVVLGVILILDTLGFDVTTGLAALGIGGIALALGAQKTVENFVGSVTLIADQPIRVGDYCKVGEIAGTVEQIGMRSTRIRTINRTIVTIPNGDFSSEKIETFATRDRFLYNPNFRLRFETTPEQIRYLLVELRTILYAHPKVDPSPARIRFTEIGTEAFKLEVFAYVKTLDFDEFLEIQEDLLLRMMDVVNASGTSLAVPTQRILVNREPELSEEKKIKAEATVQNWRAKGEIQIPKFDPDRIEELKDTLDYPPEGSAQGKGKQTYIE